MESNDAFFKEQHLSISDSPIMWQLSAQRLIVSARILRRERESIYGTDLPKEGDLADGFFVGHPEKMLWGFAVECLLKGLWVDNNNSVFNDKGRFVGVMPPNKQSIDQHDLVQLADALGIAHLFNEKETFVLKSLTVFTKSFGRYPSAKGYIDMLPVDLPEGGQAPLTSWLIPDYDEAVDHIIEKLKAQFSGSAKP